MIITCLFEKTSVNFIRTDVGMNGHHALQVRFFFSCVVKLKCSNLSAKSYTEKQNVILQTHDHLIF